MHRGEKSSWVEGGLKGAEPLPNFPHPPAPSWTASEEAQRRIALVGLARGLWGWAQMGPMWLTWRTACPRFHCRCFDVLEGFCHPFKPLKDKSFRFIAVWWLGDCCQGLGFSLGGRKKTEAGYENIWSSCILGTPGSLPNPVFLDILGLALTTFIYLEMSHCAFLTYD